MKATGSMAAMKVVHIDAGASCSFFCQLLLLCHNTMLYQLLNHNTFSMIVYINNSVLVSCVAEDLMQIFPQCSY